MTTETATAATPEAETPFRLPELGAISFPSAESFNADTFAVDFLRVGEEWANAAAALELMEEGRKVMLAKLVQKHQAVGFAASAKGIARQTAEDRALADPEYKSYLLRLKEYRLRSNQSRVRWDSCKMYVELIRSKMATMRAEMSLR